MGYYAVIDTETSWSDKVISIGVVIADEQSFRPVDGKYYVIEPTYKEGGMYANALDLRNKNTIISYREKVITDILVFFRKYNISAIFAYNAAFDYRHLQELNGFEWYDIMSIAAYKQYNRSIPATAECCNTGKLKKNYGVEPIMQMLCGSKCYCERHNALQDALDELRIMQLLGVDLKMYKCI